MKSNPEMEQKLLEAAQRGLIVSRTENNSSLKVSYKGAGSLVTPKWNIKIYTNGTAVCTDSVLLQDILNDKVYPPDSSLKVVQIDDSGWGFPLLGCFLGLVIEGEQKVWTETLDVKYFQSPLWETKAYLNEYTNLGIKLLNRLGVTPGTHRVEICTGYINKNLKNLLREQGFDVRVVEIKGLLQDQLETLFKEYVKSTLGEDLVYDPKGLEKHQLGQAYYKVLNWGLTHTPQLLKSGWKAVQEKLNA